MKAKTLVTVFVLFMVAMVCAECALFKKVTRTVNDAAKILCEVFAQEHAQDLQGFSPTEWCAIHENLQPFIDAALEAKQSAGQVGLHHEQ